MSKDEIQLLFEYDRWANNRVLQAVSTLSVEQFTRDLGGSFHSVRDTLVHIIGGEWGWLTIWKAPSVSSAFVTDLWTRLDALFPPECIPRHHRGAVKVGRTRTRTSRVCESPHKRIIGKDGSCSHNTNQLGTLDATSGESFHLPSGSSRAYDAAACCCAGRHGLRLVFTGGTRRGIRCTLVYSVRGILPQARTKKPNSGEQ